MSRTDSVRRSPEAKLLGLLCRRAMPGTLSSPDMQELCHRCAAVGDWDFFLRLVEGHRIVPLVLKGMTGVVLPVPEEVGTRLRARGAGNAYEAFRYLAEAQRYISLLNRAAIPVIVLKGVPLAMQAFGEIAMREVGDIDLLIDPADVERADQLLQGSAMVRQEPAARLTPRRRRVYAHYFKDYTYAPSPAFEVDLHWRLVRDTRLAARLLPRDRSTSTQQIHLGSLELTTLNFERTLLYLAVHGALERWPRFKALADIAALWAGAGEEMRASAWALAAAQALTPFLQAALFLAEDWLGDLPQSRAPATSAGEQALVSSLLRSARPRRELPPQPGQEESSFGMKLHEARLNPDAAARVELAGRILFRPRAWQAIDLPDPLFFLYPLLSPVEWLWFRLQRARKREVQP